MVLEKIATHKEYISGFETIKLMSIILQKLFQKSVQDFAG